MDFTNTSTEELVERRSAIAAEAENADADLDALEAEVRAINEELDTRKAEINKRNSIRDAVAQGAGVVIEKFESEDRKMPDIEIRNTAKYIDAFANFVKTGDDRECRALLTENVSGDVPVPEFVDEIVHTAWESDAILSRVRRVYIRGNLKVAFERSADDAVVHTEGTSAISEENLALGIVTLLAKNVKKYLDVSDETLALTGEAFLRYIYDELTYRIVKKLAALVIADIATASTSHSSSAVGVPKLTLAPSVTLVATGAANLSDEAVSPVVIMNRLSEVNFLAAAASGNFAIDPFAGLPRVYSSALPAYDTASDNAVYAIVGDLSGATVNYPEGDGVVIKFDDITLAPQDLVRITGRQFAAHGVTAPGKFVNIAKPAAAST